MRLVAVGPKVTEVDVQMMLGRVGVKEAEINEVMGESDWVLSVRQRGNYTVAMITTKSFPTAMGVAKRNPVDKEMDEAGVRLALRRCFEEAKSLVGPGEKK
jgi:hypothetical protein